MTEYRSIHPSSHKLKWDPNESRVSIHHLGDLAYFVQLSDIDRRNLAFDLLEKDFDVQPHVSDGGYTMMPRLPKVGEFYKVVSTPKMAPRFQGDPILRVVEVGVTSGFGSSMIMEFPDGSKTSWGANKKNLEGPIKVTESKVWTEDPE